MKRPKLTKEQEAYTKAAVEGFESFLRSGQAGQDHIQQSIYYLLQSAYQVGFGHGAAWARCQQDAPEKA